MNVEKAAQSPTEKVLFYIGIPLSLLVFAYIFTMPTPEGLGYNGKVSMATFAFALILWVSGSLPTHVTSLIVIIILSIFGGWDEKSVLGVFGYYVIWLMVAAFIITSGMEKSGFARRLALGMVTKFGKSTITILISLFVVNFLLAFVIPSTTARAAVMLPIMLLIADAYGVNKGNINLGKLMGIQGLQSNALSTSAILTATAPQILAIGLVKEMTDFDFGWAQWFAASAPIAILSLVASFLIGLMLYKPEKVIAGGGGIQKLKDEYNSLGKMTTIEKKALFIFGFTIILWATDKWHVGLFGFQLSLVMVAVISATMFFLPHIGILKWNEAKIPWNLMIFSAGAYAAGISLNATGVATWALEGIFDSLGVKDMGFTGLYAVVIFISSFSHFVFTSKTVRTIIVIPTVIALATSVGINPIALAIPAAFTIADTITLPPHCKPNLIYFSTGFYTIMDQLKYGILVLLAKWLLMFAASFTWFKYLGII